ncbi:5-(carboxyamino)imidazole ribonucleotide mutase [Corynebacterium fournieri]|uniref:5-(carboxyamino)imidazole ribonucleotide mutase n=2 Tax=Corynebacterium fournieri TaxID=1852390 RepID=UPI0022A8AE02|nr:5-(carboxyamino)imidazole ribonucleotide mutase [Corynebacterium fournieri]WJY96933.1 N5-carboxyaminoimidazole ribonucleotide mutase [Corynebacterium fournieri]
MAQPQVGIIMGSDSDWDTVAPAAEVLAEFGIPFEVGVVSAHRTPEKMLAYAKEAHTRELKVIIACAGGAAHLPGMVAAATPLPVIGIPRALDTLDGLDSLLSIVQMPGGVPVATVSIGGAKNAGLLAARILGADDPSVQRQMVDYQARMASEVERKDEALRQRLMGE